MLASQRSSLRDAPMVTMARCDSLMPRVGEYLWRHCLFRAVMAQKQVVPRSSAPCVTRISPVRLMRES